MYCHPTDLTVPVILVSASIGLIHFLVELPDHVIFSVHDVKVFVLVPFTLLVLILAATTDIIEDLA